MSIPEAKSFPATFLLNKSFILLRGCLAVGRKGALSIPHFSVNPGSEVKNVMSPFLSTSLINPSSGVDHVMSKPLKKLPRWVMI